VSWDGDDAGEEEAPDPEQIARLINRLDGRTRTLVMLHRAGSVLAVGGSQTGMVVYIEDSGGRFWQLRSADVSDELVQMVAGGQPGEYAARFVTSRADAIRAATEFAATGERAPLGWEQT
jgi:hypothetical protein